MPRAYSYIRFSTPEQLKGDSLRRQLDLSNAYALAHGLELDDKLTFHDQGVSAFNRSNLKVGGQLRAFLDATDAGVVEPGSYLLVESLDRISRAQILDALEVFTGLLNRGIKIVTLADGMEYTKEKANERFSDLIISITIMSRAHEESLMKSKRVAAAWEAKRTRIGEQKLTSLCPAWLKLNASRDAYDLIPERALVVRRIIDLFLSGRGKHALAKLLNEEGVPTFGEKGSRTWFPSYISKILTNRALIGEFQPHKATSERRVAVGEPVEDYFPKLLSKEEFASLSDLRAARGSNFGGARGDTFSNLFTGILHCGYCDGKMVFVNKGPGKRGGDEDANKFLVCSRSKRGAGCVYVSWQYSIFERAFLGFARGIDFQRFLAHREGAKTSIEKLELARRHQAHELTGLDQRQSRLILALETEDSPPATVVERIKELEQLKTVARAKYQSLTGELENEKRSEALGSAAAATITSLIDAMEAGDSQERFLLRSSVNEHLRRAIDSVKLFPGGLINSAEEVAKIRAELISDGGHVEEEIEEHMKKHEPAGPVKANRFFTLKVKDRTLQVLRPDSDNPHWEAPRTALS